MTKSPRMLTELQFSDITNTIQAKYRPLLENPPYYGEEGDWEECIPCVPLDNAVEDAIETLQRIEDKLNNLLLIMNK